MSTATEYLGRRDLRQRSADRDKRGGRRTALRREDFERRLTCSACGTEEIIFEAAQGARNETEHRYNDPSSFLCLECFRGSL